MRRLFWVGVGVAVTVVVLRRGRAVVEQYVPAGATDAVGGALALGTALRTAREDFRSGVAEREAELLEALVGDVDLDTVRANAPRHRAELREAFGRPARDDLAQGLAARGWADEPVTDPDDDEQAPFF